MFGPCKAPHVLAPVSPKRYGSKVCSSDICTNKSLGLCCSSSSMEKPGRQTQMFVDFLKHITFWFAWLGLPPPTWKQDMTSPLCNVFVSFTGYTLARVVYKMMCAYICIYTCFVQFYSIFHTTLYTYKCNKFLLGVFRPCFHPDQWFASPFHWTPRTPTDDGFHDSNFALSEAR